MHMQPCFVIYTKCVCTVGSYFIRFLVLSLPACCIIALYLADSAGHWQQMCGGDCDVCSREVGHSSVAKRSVSVPFVCHCHSTKSVVVKSEKSILMRKLQMGKQFLKYEVKFSRNLVSSRRNRMSSKTRAEEKNQKKLVQIGDVSEKIFSSICTSNGLADQSYLLLLLLLLLLTEIEFSLGGSSPYISTDKTDTNKYT